jgi:anti-sigma B factor antagonist
VAKTNFRGIWKMKHKILQPSGLLDGQNANQIRREITDIVSEGISTIKIDFQKVSFINSSAIGALVATLKMVRASGGEIFLYSLNNQVKMIFELTKMDQIFKISNDRSELDENLIAKS